jgi:hypothetical protein
MKKTIRELIKKPNANRKVLKKALKREIKALYIMGKFPPRFYAYKMMLKNINDTIFFPEIFNEEILDKEFEVEE